jgi:transmembrane sensor
MNKMMEKTVRHKTDEIFEQASFWYLQLKDNPSDTLLIEFQRWVNENEAHEECYVEVLLLWQELDGAVIADKIITDVCIEEPFTKTKKQSVGFISYSKVARCSALFLSLLLVFVFLPEYLWRSADYSTGTAEQKSYTLDDGSIVHLNAQSAINVDIDQYTRTIELLYGEAFFEVAPDAERPFKVSAGNILAQAIGTAFNIRLLNGQSQTTLTEGKLKLDLGAKTTLMISAGQRVEWDGADQPQVYSSDYSYLPNWKKGMLRLDSMPLRNVIALLNRHYPSVVTLLDLELADKIVRGTLPLNNLNIVLSELESSLGVQHINLSGRVVLLY